MSSNDPIKKDVGSAAQEEASESESNDPKSETKSGVAHTPPRNNDDSNDAKKKSDQRRETALKVIPVIISFVALGVSFGSCYGSNRSADTAEQALMEM